MAKKKSTSKKVKAADDATDATKAASAAAKGGAKKTKAKGGKGKGGAKKAAAPRAKDGKKAATKAPAKKSTAADKKAKADNKADARPAAGKATKKAISAEQVVEFFSQHLPQEVAAALVDFVNVLISHNQPETIPATADDGDGEIDVSMTADSGGADDLGGDEEASGREALLEDDSDQAGEVSADPDTDIDVEGGEIGLDSFLAEDGTDLAAAREEIGTLPKGRFKEVLQSMIPNAVMPTAIHGEALDEPGQRELIVRVKAAHTNLTALGLETIQEIAQDNEIPIDFGRVKSEDTKLDIAVQAVLGVAWQRDTAASN